MARFTPGRRRGSCPGPVGVDADADDADGETVVDVLEVLDAELLDAAE